MSNSDIERHLGDYLRQHREKKGFTLEQVSSATKINIKILHFLEAGQFSELPSKPFLRGFISAYCHFVGLDSKDTLTRFDAYIDEGLSGQSKNKKKYTQFSIEAKEVDPSRKLILGILIGFIFVGLVSIIIMKPKMKKRHEAHLAQLKKEEVKPVEVAPEAVVVQGETPPVVPASQPPALENTPKPENSAPVVEAPAAPAPAVAAVVPPSEAENETPTISDPLQKGDSYPPESIRYRIVLQAKENFWVRYKVDQFEAQTFILLKEKYLVLKAMNSITFQVSNKDAVLFKKGADFLEISNATHLKKSDRDHQTEFRLGDPKELSAKSPLEGLSLLPKIEN